MPITPKGLKFLLIGLMVMVAGYALMMGGGSDDPQVFNYAMFDFRRMVAAPVVIILGIIIEVVAIMGMFGKGKKEEERMASDEIKLEEIFLAPWLHDVGKFAQRADVPELYDKGLEGQYCKTTKQYK